MSLIKWPITVKMRLKYPKPHLGCKYLKGNEIRVTQRRLPWIERAHFGKNEIEWWLLFFLHSPNITRISHRHQPKSTPCQIIDVFNWTIWTRMVTEKVETGRENKKNIKRLSSANKKREIRFGNRWRVAVTKYFSFSVGLIRECEIRNGIITLFLF